MMHVGEIAVGMAGLYLAVSLVFQVRPLSPRFPTLDMLGIIPRWLFFTQGVGSYTLAMKVRTRSANGQPSDWQQLSLWPQRRWWHWIYYPQQYQSGILWNALDRVARRADAQKAIAHTQAHVTLVRYVMQTAPTGSVQFAVLRYESGQSINDADILFTSDWISQ